MTTKSRCLQELELIIQQEGVKESNIVIALDPDIPRLLCKIYKQLHHTCGHPHSAWVEPYVALRFVIFTGEKEICSLGLTFTYPDTKRFFLHISVDPRLGPERYFFDYIQVVTDLGHGPEMYDFKYDKEETAFAELVKAYKAGMRIAESAIASEEEPALPPTPMMASIYDYAQEITDFYITGCEDICFPNNEQKRQIFRNIALFLRDLVGKMILLQTKKREHLFAKPYEVDGTDVISSTR